MCVSEGGGTDMCQMVLRRMDDGAGGQQGRPMGVGAL